MNSTYIGDDISRLGRAVVYRTVKRLGRETLECPVQSGGNILRYAGDDDIRAIIADVRNHAVDRSEKIHAGKAARYLETLIGNANPPQRREPIRPAGWYSESKKEALRNNR